MEKIKLKWVMNVYNPENNDAREKLSSVFSTGKEKKWQKYISGINSFIKGVPSGSKNISSNQLLKQGVIGLYEFDLGFKYQLILNLIKQGQGTEFDIFKYSNKTLGPKIYTKVKALESVGLIKCLKSGRYSLTKEGKRYVNKSISRQIEI